MHIYVYFVKIWKNVFQNHLVYLHTFLYTFTEINNEKICPYQQLIQKVCNINQSEIEVHHLQIQKHLVWNNDEGCFHSYQSVLYKHEEVDHLVVHRGRIAF